MNIQEKIKQDIIQARKNKDTKLLSVLTFLMSNLQNKAIELKRDLRNMEVFDLFEKQIKQCEKGYLAYLASTDIKGSFDEVFQQVSNMIVSGNSNHLLEKAYIELYSISVLNEYLKEKPKPLTEDEIKQKVQTIINSQESANMSAVMKIAKKQFEGIADMKLVVSIVTELLK